MAVSFPGKRKFSAAWDFRLPLGVILTLFLSVAAVCGGQDEQPLIVPRRTIPMGNQKPRGKEPRAIAVVQLNGGKGTLIPVAILINGRFFDASAYKADPVPMALESGTVYELEQAGDSQGLFTVNGALHSKAAVTAHPWVGTGSFLAPGKEASKNTRKAEDVPIGLKDTGDEPPPRLMRQESSKSGASGSGGSSSSGAGSGEKSSGSAPAPSTGNTSSAGSPPSGGSGQDGSKPSAPSTGDKSDQTGKQPASPQASSPPAPGQSSAAKEGDHPSTGTSTSGGSDNNYYRPVLRRGKPTTEAPPDEEDNVAAKKISETGIVSGISGTGASAGKVLAAISDAAGPEPSSYKVFWKAGEEDERRNQMIVLAQNEVRAYAAALVKNEIPARPTAPKSGVLKGRQSTKQAEVALDNVEFHGFDVWLNNAPVMILTAEAHFPGEANSPGMPESYSVTVVARTDIYGNLQKLYSGVTDKSHLDVTPRLELVDAVDADGDGRAELLFQETTDVGRGYLIYRATADRLWKMFDSLNAE